MGGGGYGGGGGGGKGGNGAGAVERGDRTGDEFVSLSGSQTLFQTLRMCISVTSDAA